MKAKLSESVGTNSDTKMKLNEVLTAQLQEKVDLQREANEANSKSMRCRLVELEDYNESLEKMLKRRSDEICDLYNENEKLKAQLAKMTSLYLDRVE